jgi:penicillin amidase
MSPKLKKFLVGVFIVLLILVMLAGVSGYISVRQSFPETEGNVITSEVGDSSLTPVQGVDQTVDIYRDSMGIPHIYAATLHDLFYAQGYVHAQDRFWQMDFWRHIGSARLSEMFGESQVETDAFLRTLGWRQIAEMEWENLSPEPKAILTAYTDGVNAYLADHSGTELSLEYGILKLINPGYSVEPWTPIHSLTWAKAMAWDLRGNMGEEIERSILLKTLTMDQVDELFPPYPSDHPVIVPEIGDFTATASSKSQTSIQNTSYLDTEIIKNIEINIGNLDRLLGPSGTGIGSNSWAVSGALTATGKPLLANDPHLGIQMPSIWYQISLHCKPVSDACPYQVGGFSFAGVPGVVIGHNDQVAWAFTNVGPDVMDLFVEKVNPDNPNQYEVNGQWVDMISREEVIQVAGGAPVTITVRSTRHGPVVSDTYEPLMQILPTVEPDETPMLPYADRAGIPLPDPYVVSLRWTALEPGSVFEAIWGFNKAKDWQEFREATKHFQVPAQNLLFSDIQGNIAYQMPGRIPIRQNGDGRLPVPGWTDEFEWTGYIPFDDLPFQVNPPSGYIVTANNQVPPVGYPYLVTTDWDYGFRAQRIVDMIQNSSGPIDIPYIQMMQGDNQNLIAETFLPILAESNLELTSPNEEEAYRMLQNWNGRDEMDSQAAAIFEWFWWNLLMRTFSDDLPEEYWPGGGNRWFEVMRQLVNEPNSPWWDDHATEDKIETRDDILLGAFSDSVGQMEQEYGREISRWPEWGDLHTSTFKNATLGESGIAPIEVLFNRGPFATGGGDSIVNATGWTVGESFEVDWLPSMRMIVDLSNLDNSLTVHTTGQSGHAYHDHYIDMADLWRNIQYYPMWWEEASIIYDSEGHFQLLP